MNPNDNPPPLRVKVRRQGRRPELIDATARDTIEQIMYLAEKHRRPPSRREVMLAVGNKSLNSILEHLNRLYRRGFVYYEIGVIRSLVVTPEGEAFLKAEGERFRDPHEAAEVTP